MALGTNNKVKVEGGMASMTDLVFLLLIFFIIMSLMSNQNTRVDVPKTSEDLKPLKNPTTATVIVTEDNQYVVMPGGDMENPRAFEDIRGEAEAARVEQGGDRHLAARGPRRRLDSRRRPRVPRRLAERPGAAQDGIDSRSEADAEGKGQGRQGEGRRAAVGHPLDRGTGPEHRGTDGSAR